MKLRKSHVFTGVTALTLVASFAGGISGTIAWYASSTRVSLSYEGTSVAQAEQLQIGLQSDIDFRNSMEDINHNVIDLGLRKETLGGKDYYFAAAGSGLSAVAIQGYLKTHGFAQTELCPVTSMAYANGDALNLKRSPMAFSTNIYNAQKTSYCQLNFVFRVIHTGTELPVAGENIWLTDAIATTGGDADHEIYKAIRIHFAGENPIIVNPGVGKEAPAGDTPVAGLLDLNNDGYYDAPDNLEIVYGDYEKKAAHPDNTPSNHFVHFDSNVREDMNSYVTETRTAKSTFYADHRIGMDGYDRTAFSSYITPHVAHYETLKSIGPSDNGAGVLSGGTPLCVTADDDYCLASLPTTIYLEGWDHSVIDAEISHKFNLGLQFQINRTA